MLFNGNLLKRYINIKDNAENIADYLTLKTCEIEEIQRREIPDEVVVGYVTKCEKHPDADKLKITEVDCGEKWKYQIVTGAVNIKTDIYVPVALPWSYLPVKDLKIKPVKMRWVDSNGMICSKEELGIAEDLDIHGIWILDEDLNTLSKEDLWKKLSDEVPFLNNFVFDIDNKTLTNRPDLTGHLWQAIELNAIYRKFDNEKIYMNNIPQIFELFNHTNIFETLDHSNKAEKKVFVDSEKTRTYLTLELKNVEVKKSDFKERLELIDLEQEPRNNWVDFSNLFMILTSQPIHFFDADKIEWNIVVTEAEWGEKFTDLTWKEHTLEKWDIIIKDNEKILALAGIIWWAWSEVSEYTQNILVEIANFDPIQVRKTGNRLDLRTDAKIRFEKNISPLFSLYALILFLDQLKISWLKYDLGGISYDFKEDVKKLFSKYIDVDFDDLRSFSWINISDEEIKNILENLGFIVLENNHLASSSNHKASYYKIKVPAWRSPADMNIKEDIYEEVIRIYGYENISWTELERNMSFVPFNPKTELVRIVEEEFVEENHFNLVETYPWFNLNTLEKIKKPNLDKLLSLKNPTAPENKYLRANLCFNLLEVVAKNFREFDTVKVIETWKIFRKDFWEKLVAGAMVYQKEVKDWKNNNIFILKNAVKDILKTYQLKGLLEYKIIDENDDKFQQIWDITHPKQRAKILLNKQEIWVIASLHPYYHKEFKIPEKAQITYLQLDLEKLIELKSKLKSKPVVKLNYYTLEDQIVERDLSFVISKDEEYGKVIFAVSKVKEIVDVEVFDIYDIASQLNSEQWIVNSKGNNSYKSISLRIKIYWEKMTSEDINKVMDKAIKEAEKVGAKLR